MGFVMVSVNMRQNNITTITREGQKPLYRIYLGKIDGRDKYKSSTNINFMIKLAERLNKDQALSLKGASKDQIELLNNERELLYAMSVCRDMGVSVIDCVNYYKDHASKVTNVKMVLREAGELYVESMKNRNVSDATLSSTNTIVNKIVKLHGDKLVSEITQQTIHNLIFKRKTKLAPKSVNNLIGSYSTFFIWCIKQGYTAINPCEKLDKVKVLEPKREILSLDDMETYLNYCYDNGYYRELASLVLQSFCGFRVTEAASLTFGDVDIYGTYDLIKLSAAGAKLKQQRNNEVLPNAKVWLLLAFKGLGLDDHKKRDAAKDELIIENSRWRLYKLRAAFLKDTKIKIPANSPRHSFASYHYAGYKNLMDVKRMMGHGQSDAMFFRHYRIVVSPRRGLAYFDILPSKELQKGL